jgi:hypothetical protein
LTPASQPPAVMISKLFCGPEVKTVAIFNKIG